MGIATQETRLDFVVLPCRELKDRKSGLGRNSVERNSRV